MTWPREVGKRRLHGVWLTGHSHHLEHQLFAIGEEGRVCGVHRSALVD